MILGIDIGNYATKTSQEMIFTSKCSKIGNILGSVQVITDDGKIYVGDGSFDTEYRKIKKEYIKTLFTYAVATSSTDIANKVIVGLPLSQYKQDKDALRNLLLSQKIYNIAINGTGRKIIIEDLAVYPEGVGAIIGNKFEGIVIDIGGRTTDVCVVTDNDGVKKVHNPYSIPKGTLNLYSDFIKVVNSEHGLDLTHDDAYRIIKFGLKISGEPVDCSFAVTVFRQFVEELVNLLQVDYSLKTQDVLLIGGGCQLLYNAIRNRIPAARLIGNPIFANAIGFKKAGEQMWQ